MKNKYFIILTFLCAAVLFIPKNMLAQKLGSIKIESIVNDEEGNPIEGAQISSGQVYAKTDASGAFSIITGKNKNVIIDAKSFVSISFKASEIMHMPKITLVKTMISSIGNDDLIDLPFRKVRRNEIVGAVSTITPADINKYDNSIWASSLLSGRTTGMYGGTNIRGLGIGVDVANLTGTGTESGNTLYIVDGLPRSIEGLRSSEIEQITVLKDVNAAALYGSAAVNGVIMITTKRGDSFKKKSNISLNYGISTIKSTPDYLNSADYMKYYNQARENDGLENTYSMEDIDNAENGNKYRYPDVDYYSDDVLKSFKSYFDLNGEFSGGNENAKYYTNFGWNSSGGILDFGEGANARNNVFNVRGNVDLKVNEKIKTSIDASAVYGNNKSQRGSYWSNASTIRPNEFTPLLPFDLISKADGSDALSTLNARKRDVDGMYLIGGNSNHISTPFGDGYASGEVEAIYRKFAFNNRVDFDLNSITEGLALHTNISFDYFMAYNQTVASTYSSYEPTWDENDSIISLKQYGTDANPGTQVVGSTKFKRRFGFYGLLNYDRTFKDVHHFTGSLLGYSSIFKETSNFQGIKQAHAGLQLGYTYDNKYVLDFGGAYVNSVKLADGNRGGFSPSLGLGWIISNEDFLSSCDNIDFLKFKLSGGILQSDLPIASFFYYDDRYYTSSGYSWYEGTRSRSGVRSSWSSNLDLGFSKRKEINMGFEGLFFDNLLGLEANAFYDVYSDLVTRPYSAYPSYYSNFIPYENFNEDTYKGLEVGVNLNKQFGKWNLYVGANLLYSTSERTIVDETYNNKYQYREGEGRSATFGLESLGLFQTQTEIDESPLQSWGTVQPGDIKYKDQNGDGIVDQNDEVFLRDWQAPWSGGLQVKLSYENFTLFILGQGQKGAKNFKEGSYFWIDGNDKYTGVVRGAWTEETAASATYPRLSSQTNSNNFRRSSYWLYDTDYFSIKNIQLTYNMPESISRVLYMKNMDLFINASDVYQFSKNRDIMETRVGNEPYYRTFSIGIKAGF